MSTDAVNLSYFHSVLKQAYQRGARVTHMKSLASWSGLGEKGLVPKLVRMFSHFRHFLSHSCRLTRREPMDSMYLAE